MPPYLPPGFQFIPTHLELIKYYLQEKVLGNQLPPDAVIEGEVYGDNAQLPEADDIGNRELYIFVKIERNKNGTKTKRLTKNGYWKVTGNKKEIKDERGCHIGTMRSLVFVEKKKCDSGRKKKLLMDEYTLDGSLNIHLINPEGWVLCKIKQSNRSPERPRSQEEEEEDEYGLTNISLDGILPLIEDSHMHEQRPVEFGGGPSHLWQDPPFNPLSPVEFGGGPSHLWKVPPFNPSAPVEFGGGPSHLWQDPPFNPSSPVEFGGGPSHLWQDPPFNPSSPVEFGGGPSHLWKDPPFNPLSPVKFGAGPSHLWQDPPFNPSSPVEFGEVPGHLWQDPPFNPSSPVEFGEGPGHLWQDPPFNPSSPVEFGEGPSHLWQDPPFNPSSEMEIISTSRPTASPALQGIDNISSVDMDVFWASMEDNQAMAEPAGEPSHMWSDQYIV